MTRAGSVDGMLIATAAVLCLLGLVFLYSSSAWVSERQLDSPHGMFVSQAIKAAMGLVLMVVVGLVDYRRYGDRWGWALWAGTLLMLLFLALPHGHKETIRHTDRWIQLGPFSIQPSEFARVTMVLVVAGLASRLEGVWRGRRRLVGLAVAVVLPVVLILFQPNFGTATAMGASALLLLVLAGLPWRWFFGGGAVLAAGAALVTLIYSYPQQRVLAWFHGLSDWDALPFQIKQGLIALGSGGLLGQGLGQSLQKRLYVPDPHTDLIITIIGEEVGFLGILALMVLFGVLIWRGIVIASRAPDRFGYLLAGGITVQLALYALVNAGVATGLLPVTGLPLPFVSYGGSALMANLASVGILISVSRAGSWSGVRAQRKVMEIGFR